MKKYNKPTLEIIKIRSTEVLTLSADPTGKDDNNVSIWDLPLSL